MTWDWTPETLASLERFLAERGLTQGPVTTRRIGDGHSNLTFLVADGVNQVVVRRPPPPPVGHARAAPRARQPGPVRGCPGARGHTPGHLSKVAAAESRGGL